MMSRPEKKDRSKIQRRPVSVRQIQKAGVSTKKKKLSDNLPRKLIIKLGYTEKEILDAQMM